MYSYWLTQTKALLMYLKLAVWPQPLLVHYQLPYLNSLAEAWMYVLPVVLIGSLLLLLLCGGLLLRLRALRFQRVRIRLEIHKRPIFAIL